MVAGRKDKAGEVNMEHGTWKECCLEDDFPLDMVIFDVNFLGSRMVQVEYMRCNVGAMLYTLYRGIMGLYMPYTLTTSKYHLWASLNTWGSRVAIKC